MAADRTHASLFFPDPSPPAPAAPGRTATVRALFGCCLVLVLALAGSVEPARCAVQMTSEWSRNPSPAGEPLDLLVSVRWEGDSDQYAVAPPQPELPDGLVRISTSSTSTREGSENVLTFQIRMSAPKEGSYGPITVPIRLFRKGEEPSTLPIETQPVTIGSPGSQTMLPWLLAGLSLAALGCAGAFVLFRRSRRERGGGPSETDAAGELTGLLETLEAARLRGDSLSFLQTALRMRELHPQEDQADLDSLKALLDQVQYGGRRLSGEELERWCREIRRRARDRAGLDRG